MEEELIFMWADAKSLSYINVRAFGIGLLVDLDGRNGLDLPARPAAFPLPQTTGGSPAQPTVPSRFTCIKKIRSSR